MTKEFPNELDYPPSGKFAEKPNHVAYWNALKEGIFDNFKPGTWVYYSQGEIIAAGPDRQELLEQHRDKKLPGGFIVQVGVPAREANVPTQIKID